jgi:hypothetical protein
VGERHGELEGQREQRQARAPSRTRPEPTHRRYALRAPLTGTCR